MENTQQFSFPRLNEAAPAFNARTTHGDRTLEDQVLTYLHDKTVLLVLDNVEHLPGAAEPISALLDAAPWVKVLVTAQESLNFWDEWFFPLQGLAAPPDVTTPDALANSPAVTLFALTASQRPPLRVVSAHRCA